MRVIGNVESAARPEPLRIGDRYAEAASDVRELTREADGGAWHGYAYTLTQYTLAEYLAMMAAQRDAQAAELTNVQLALCELAEGV